MGERHEPGAIALAIDDIFATAAAAPSDQFAFKVHQTHHQHKTLLQRQQLLQKQFKLLVLMIA